MSYLNLEDREDIQIDHSAEIIATECDINAERTDQRTYFESDISFDIDAELFK